MTQRHRNRKVQLQSGAANGCCFLGERGRNQTFNLLIKSQPWWPREMASKASDLNAVAVVIHPIMRFLGQIRRLGYLFADPYP